MNSNPASASSLDHSAASPASNPWAAADERSASDERVSAADLEAALPQLKGWAAHGGVLVKTFEFTDFHGTMAFVNAVAWIAHRGDHHPDLQVGYKRCTVQWSTHSAGGLTLKDLICAAQVDAL